MNRGNPIEKYKNFPMPHSDFLCLKRKKVFFPENGSILLLFRVLVLRFYLDCHVKCYECFIMPSEKIQGKPFVVPRIGVLRINLDCLVKSYQCLFIFFKVCKCISFIIPGICVIRGQMNCLVTCFNCFVMPVKDIEDRSFVVPCHGIIRIDCYGFVRGLE